MDQWCMSWWAYNCLWRPIKKTFCANRKVWVVTWCGNANTNMGAIKWRKTNVNSNKETKIEEEYGYDIVLHVLLTLVCSIGFQSSTTDMEAMLEILVLGRPFHIVYSQNYKKTPRYYTIHLGRWNYWCAKSMSPRTLERKMRKLWIAKNICLTWNEKHETLIYGKHCYEICD